MIYKVFADAVQYTGSNYKEILKLIKCISNPDPETKDITIYAYDNDLTLHLTDYLIVFSGSHRIMVVSQEEFKFNWETLYENDNN